MQRASGIVKWLTLAQTKRTLRHLFTQNFHKANVELKEDEILGRTTAYATLHIHFPNN